MKPPGAKGESGLSPKIIKAGAWVLGIAVVIGISHVLSPSGEAEDAGATAKASREPAVLKLDDTSFESFLAEHPEGALVNFNSQSCHFCAKLAPEFEKAAQQSKANGGPPFVSLDSALAPQQMKRFGIDRYPTVYWFWKGQNTLEYERAPEKTAENMSTWAQWAYTSPAVQELEAKQDIEESLPLMRSTLHSQHKLFVAYNHTGFEGLRTALETVAQRNKAKTVFLFIREVTSEGPLIKAYSKEEADDLELASAESTTAETLQKWVQGVVDEARIKRLEAQVEEQKARNEPLEKTLEVLSQAAKESAESADAADENAAPA
jgi:thioredoxin-like negative regulator of GroEL